MSQEHLSRKLKAYRKQEHLTQEELAERLHVSNKSISKWERGHGHPSRKNMITIATLLDVPPEVLTVEEPPAYGRGKRSLLAALISYCLIFALTLLIRGIQERGMHQHILDQSIWDIFALLMVAAGENIGIALLPSVVIGLVFYWYIIPKTQNDEDE